MKKAIIFLVVTFIVTTSYGQFYKTKSSNYQTLDSLVRENWNVSTNQWIEYGKEVFSYDSIGNKGLIYFQKDSSKASWRTVYKIDYIFDENDFLSEAFLSDWNSDSMKWLTNQKNNYLCDLSGNIVQVDYYSKDTLGLWIENNIRTDYFYQYNRLDSFLSTGIHNEIDTSWIVYNKNAFSYYLDGSIKSIWYSDIMNDSISWIPYAKDTCIWDVNENMTAIRLNWNNNTYKWDSVAKTEVSYDNSYLFENLYTPNYIENYFFFYMPVKLVSSVYQENNWTNSARINYYFSSNGSTNISIIDNKETLKVFPNPTNDYVIFCLKNEVYSFQLELFDLQGNKVVNQTIYNGIPFYINNLSNGLYFFQLMDNELIYNGKLLIK